MTDSPSRPDISIIVVNWNVPALLEGCLKSIQREVEASGLHIDVSVVDSASTIEGHREVLKRHVNVGLVQLDENRGYGAACNAGARATSGSTILFLNPDTVVHPGALEALLRATRIAPHIGLVAPILLNVDGSVQSMGYRFPGPANVLCDLLPVPARLYESSLNGRVPAGNGHLPLAIDYALGAALMVRRSAFDEAGGFDEDFFMYSEEVDFQRRLADLGWTRMLVPTAHITHLGGQSTGQQPDDMYEALWTSRAQYFNRWSTGHQRKLLRMAVTLGFRVDSKRHPARARLNQRVAETFATTLAGS